MLGSPILYLKGMRIMMFQLSGFYCKAPCTLIVYTLAPKYLYRDHSTANMYYISTWTRRVTACMEPKPGQGQAQRT